MIEFPDWSDLGLGKLSERTRWSWDFQLMEMERYRYYYDGDVFQEKVPVEQGNEEEAPLLYPVGINLVKMLTTAQSDAAFGEYEGLPLRFGVRQDQNVTDADIAAIDLAHTILESSNAHSMLWEHELDRNVFGGGAIKITTVLNRPGHLLWSRVPRESFFPIWDPDDPNRLLEVFIVVYMSAEQAWAKYRYQAHNDRVTRVEHWTETSYENFLDGVRLGDYSGVNPWGIIPFVYTPRLRFITWWGEALTPDIMTVQDEVNMRVADIGEAINYNSHPTRWGVNLPRDFNSENFPLGANSMWNLGRQLSGNPPPQVGILEARAAVQPGVLEHVNFLYDWARTSVFAPPIAFGEDNGGGQRSGITLEIRMWPLIKAVRRSRAYLIGSLTQALDISGRILRQKNFTDVPKRAITSILDRNIVPQFHPVMPRDQAAIVDEVVKLLATNPPSISLETSQAILGRGTGEVSRIIAMLADERLWANAKQLKDEEEERQMAEKEAAAMANGVSTSKDRQEKKPGD